MRVLTEDEMRRFLSNLPQILDVDRRAYAAMEHYFECVIFPDWPKDEGDKFAENLWRFTELARGRGL